jgi:two-component system chemotaxis response regulator CheB
MRNLSGHDIIVVGASAGGIDPLRQLCHDLPADLPAAVFIVVHVGIRSHLADILDRRAALPVVTAESGMAVAPGTVYVAAPGKHLLLHDGHILLRRGPRENMARPAVDPLFRSAAASYSSRVVGVILSGALNDGTAGLRAIERCGGVTVVQEPTEAIEPSMPRSAMRHVAVDHIAPAADLAALLYRLAKAPAGPIPEIPLDIRLEAAIAVQELESMAIEDKLGTLSPFTCPECHGALWEIGDGSMLRYRCHVGHAYTADAVVEAGSLEIDKMMETLLRSHRERAALVHHMAKQERGLHNDSLARQLEARAKEYDEDAELVRQLARHPTFRGRAHDGGEAGDILTNEAAQETQT